MLTELATRINPDLSGRVLFQLQGDYADRYWRPNNIEHDLDNKDRYFLLREAEAKWEKDFGFVHGFSGVSHGNWANKGDFFELYPSAYSQDDYLHHSGYFGVYPADFSQNIFLNISKNRIPKGVEAGAQFLGLDAGAAYGDELQWGYGKSGYGRLASNIAESKLTFVMKDENFPYNLNQQSDERRRAYSLSWVTPESLAYKVQAGVFLS